MSYAGTYQAGKRKDLPAVRLEAYMIQDAADRKVFDLQEDELL